MNPILQKLRPQNNVMNMMNMVRNASNPQAMLMTMAQQNPQLKQAIDIASKYSDPKTAFYEEARKRGIDPNSILNQLK